MTESREGSLPPPESQEDREYDHYRTAFGEVPLSYIEKDRVPPEWAIESTKNLEQVKNDFLELLNRTKGKFIGVQLASQAWRHKGFPLYMDRAKPRHHSIPSDRAYALGQYDYGDIISVLSSGAQPIFDDDLVLEGGTDDGIESSSRYTYDISGMTIAKIETRGGGGHSIEEVYTVLGKPLMGNDFTTFENWARRIVGVMKRKRREGAYTIPEKIQNDLAAFRQDGQLPSTTLQERESYPRREIPKEMKKTIERLLQYPIKNEVKNLVLDILAAEKLDDARHLSYEIYDAFYEYKQSLRRFASDEDNRREWQFINTAYDQVLASIQDEIQGVDEQRSSIVHAILVGIGKNIHPYGKTDAAYLVEALRPLVHDIIQIVQGLQESKESQEARLRDRY